MTTNELVHWAKEINKKYPNMDCFFRDYKCNAYKDLNKIHPHLAMYGDGNKVVIIDFPKI